MAAIEQQLTLLADAVFCPICQIFFPFSSYQQKYCSPKCKQKAYRQRKQGVTNSSSVTANKISSEGKGGEKGQYSDTVLLSHNETFTG